MDRKIRFGIIDSDTSTEAIRKVVMDGRQMKILNASEWLQFSYTERRLLLHETGTYVIPTEELIDFLDKEIGETKAIEICAGNGWIGRELSIPITDSCLQRDNKKVRNYYEQLQQPIIPYPRDIVKLEALAAVRRYKPHTVLACYATHKWRADTQTGNAWGVNFQELYKRVQRLIMVGNIVTHCDNPLLELPHKEIQLPGLLTRASDDSENRIFIWEK